MESIRLFPFAQREIEKKQSAFLDALFSSNFKIRKYVYQELRRQGSGHEDDIRFHHCRDKDGYEVDLVPENGTRQFAGVEVKAAASISSSDFRGLRKLASAAGNRFAAGVVLYDGEISASFGDSLYAVPIRRLWEAG